MDNVKLNAQLWHIFNEMIDLINQNIQQNQRIEDKKQAELLEVLNTLEIEEDKEREWLIAQTYLYPSNSGKI